MARRGTRNVTGIRGTGRVDATVVYRVLECRNAVCQRLYKIAERAEENPIPPAGSCPVCGSDNVGSTTHSSRWKYCRVCEQLKPLDAFHRHKPTGRSFKSGRQLECRDCKNTRINPLLNPRRTPDQHRESADMRRLYGTAAGEVRVDAKATFKRFAGKCFACGRDLKEKPGGPDGYRLDHTLPARLLSPLNTGPTLLCGDCNGAKAEQWPSKVYADATLRALAVVTGIPYDLLRGTPRANPKAIARICQSIDGFLARWIKYPEELKRLRKVILEHSGTDIFAGASTVPRFLLE